MKPSTTVSRRVLAAAVLAALAPLAWSQPAPEIQRRVELRGAPFGGPMRHDLMFLAGSQLEGGRIVQGAPYCADAVHESIQVLADGNRIVHRQVSRQCRDGQGRTRQEVGPAEHRRVYLRDPVSQETWMLEADTKQAVRLDMVRRGAPLAADPGMFERIVERSREITREIRDRIRPRPPGGEAPLPEPPDARVRIMMSDIRHADAVAPGMPMPPPIALHARLLGPRGPGTTTLLPGDSVDGLRADGTRTTWTIEAGKVGNEKPITIVNEVWTSPELGITVKSRDVDPVVGESHYRLQNVVRGEPDAALFRVPAEYRKVEPRAMALVPPVPPVPPAAPQPPARP